MKRILSVGMLCMLMLSGCSNSAETPAADFTQAGTEITASPSAPIHQKIEAKVTERDLPISREDLGALLAEDESLDPIAPEGHDYMHTIRKNDDFYRMVWSMMDNSGGRYAAVQTFSNDTYDMDKWASHLQFACEVYGAQYDDALAQAAMDFANERSHAHGFGKLIVQYGDIYCAMVFEAPYNASLKNYSLGEIYLYNEEGAGYFVNSFLKTHIPELLKKNIPFRTVHGLSMLRAKQQAEYELLSVNGTIKNIAVDAYHVPSFVAPYSVVAPYASEYERATLELWDGEQEIWIKNRAFTSEKLAEEMQHYLYRNTKTDELILIGSSRIPIDLDNL